MAQIINFSDAKNKAQQMGQKIEKVSKDRESLFKELLANINAINPQLGGFEEFGMLLSLPEEKFDLISPIFLDELEKSYNNTDDQILLIQAMNASGKKAEDLQEDYRKICVQIDQIDDEIISKGKKDFLKRVLGLTYNSISCAEGIAKRIVNVPIELGEGATLPKYANLGDGAVDLYCPEDITIEPGETKIISTKLKVALPYGYALLIHPRSGLSSRSKLRIANSIGLIDSQYKGEIGVIVENTDSKIRNITYDFDKDHNPVITSIEHGSPIYIGKGERFAQMRLVEVPTINFVRVDSVDGIGDDRGGGFGSSGVK